MTLKDINFSIAMYGTTPISQSTYDVGYTGDESSINVKFTVTDEADLAGATAKVHLYFADSSHIVRDLTLTGLVFNYTLVGTENDHAGVVRADIIITKGGAKYTRAGHKFRVDTSLEASAPLVEYVVDTLDTLVDGAEEWLFQAQTDFGTAQGTRAAEWVADNDTRADEFTAAQASRTTAFGASETARTSTFNTNETGRSNTFTTNENAREAAAESNQAQAAINHSTAVADHSTAVADSTLASSDHGTAVTDHSTAVVDHSTASADHTASLADQAIVDGLQDQFNEVIANATVDSEVINARQGSATLSDNLLSVKQQLEQKARTIYVDEEIAKAQLVGASVDITNFAFQSDLEYIYEYVDTIYDYADINDNVNSRWGYLTPTGTVSSLDNSSIGFKISDYYDISFADLIDYTLKGSNVIGSVELCDINKNKLAMVVSQEASLSMFSGTIDNQEGLYKYMRVSLRVYPSDATTLTQRLTLKSAQKRPFQSEFELVNGELNNAVSNLDEINIEDSYYYTQDTVDGFSDGFIYSVYTNAPVVHADYWMSPKIPTAEMDEIEYTLFAGGNPSCPLVLLNEANAVVLILSPTTTDQKFIGKILLSDYPTAKYLQFSLPKPSYHQVGYLTYVLVRTKKRTVGNTINALAGNYEKHTLKDKIILLNGDSRSSRDYLQYKNLLEQKTGSIVFANGNSGYSATLNAKNAYFDTKIKPFTHDFAVTLIGGNDSGESGTVGTFDLSSPNGIAGEALKTETDIANDYDGVFFVQAVSHYIRKYKSLYYDFRGRTDGKRPTLIMCTDLPRNLTNSANISSQKASWERKRNAIIECCDKYHVHYVDLYKLCDFDMSLEPYFVLPADTTINNGIYFMDGLHPNQYGYDIITSLVADALNKYSTMI